jgi:drug/metabolite transporter (DMT)-like permease
MMEGLGQVLALSCAVSWALAVMLLRRCGESLPAFELNLFKNGLGLALVALSIPVLQDLAIPEYSLVDLMVSLLSGFLGIAVADTWYLRALNLMGASRTGIVASSFSPFVIILSVLFLDESLSGWQVPGFGLVMAGILLVTWRQSSSEVSPANLRRGALYATCGVFMMAVGVFMVKTSCNPALSVGIRLAGGVGGMLLYVAMRNRWSLELSRLRQPQP